MGFNFETDYKKTDNTKQVTFGSVQTFQYERPEKPLRDKIKGMFGTAMKIENDDNLKLLIKNQSF